MKCVVEVNNMPEEARKYVVARFIEDTNALWFWGAFDNEEGAQKAAEDIGGLVLERGDN